MFNKKPTVPTDLENAYNALQKKVKETDPTDDDYPAMVDNLAKMHKMLFPDKEKTTWLDPKLIIPAAVGIAQVLLVLNFEHAHVLATKAVGFIKKV